MLRPPLGTGSAEAVFRELLALRPDFAPALNYLGYMNADRGVHLEEALALIEKAVALEPDNGSYLDSLGWVLYRIAMPHLISRMSA